MTNQALPGVFISYKDTSTGNNKNITSNKNGDVSLGNYARGTILDFKASKDKFITIQDNITVSNDTNEQKIVTISLRPEVSKCKCKQHTVRHSTTGLATTIVSNVL